MNLLIARMLDANSNRAREALRVLEDYARFALNDAPLSAELKSLRHTLAGALQKLPIQASILLRDTDHDVGTAIKTAAEFQRAGLADVIIAAGKRLSESLRVLEETAKTINPEIARTLEQLRYRGYTLEQTLTRIVTQSGRFAEVRLYVLLTESLCTLPWEQTLAALLSAGVHAVQLREKSLPDAEFLRRAKWFAAQCQAANVLSIINDRLDIALLANARGLHVGQTDLPCVELRKLAAAAGNDDLIIGVSTENLAQAQQALRDGATYIGVGPMFPTTTKDKSHLAAFPGPAYAAQALRETPIPSVAIGGITLDNLPQLTAVGVRTIAVCSAIISHPNPAERCKQFLKQVVS